MVLRMRNGQDCQAVVWSGLQSVGCHEWDGYDSNSLVFKASTTSRCPLERGVVPWGLAFFLSQMQG